MRLEKIDEDDVRRVPRDALARRAGVTFEAGLGQAIVELAGNVPYDVQRLAHEMWDDVKAARRSAVGLEDLHLTLTRLLGEQHMVFEESWQRLTLTQRAVLRALVLENGRELLSADVRTRHRLPGRVQRAVRAGRAREAGCRHEGKRRLQRHRLAVP